MRQNAGSEKNDTEKLIKSIKEKTKKGIKLTTDEMIYLVKNARDFFSEEEFKKIEKEFEGLCKMLLRTCKRVGNPKSWKKTK